MTTMNKSNFFKLCMQKEMYRSRYWLFRCLCVPYKDVKPNGLVPGFKDGVFYFTNPIDGVETTIEGWVDDQPLYPIKEKIKMVPGDLTCITEEVDVTIGEMLLGAINFEYGLAGKVPFRLGVKGKQLTGILAETLENDTITVDDYLRTMQAQYHLTLFAEINVSAYTPRSLQASPEALKVRDELLLQFKDQLNDPAVVAMIDEAITEADKAFMAGDDAEKFFLKDKAYAVVRKKLFHVQGGLAKLDDPSKMDYIPRSLSEGYAPEDLPAIINSLRSGSYDRGASTALGGEAAKFSNRVFQNLKLAEDDCGTTIGKPERIDGQRKLEGRWLVGGKAPLTKEDLTKLKGKEVLLRDPTACKTTNRAYCGKCLGQKEVEAKTGIGPRMSEMCNVFMSISLAAFHSYASKTVAWSPELDLY